MVRCKGLLLSEGPDYIVTPYPLVGDRAGCPDSLVGMTKRNDVPGICVRVVVNLLFPRCTLCFQPAASEGCVGTAEGLVGMLEVCQKFECRVVR